MEKPRVESRGLVFGGLLKPSRLIFGLLFTAMLLAPDRGFSESGPEEPLSLIVSTSPDEPRAGMAFVVTILVDYSEPSKLTVRAPELPSFLALDRSRIEGRLIPGPSGISSRWTAIEYTFFAISAGEAELGSFDVSVPGKRAATAPFVLRVVSAQAAEKAAPQLFWRNTPSSFNVGETVEIVLVLVGGDVDRTGVPVIDAPENALVEVLPLDPKDREIGHIARIKFTALDPPSVRLPSARLTLRGGRELIAAEKEIPVRAAPSASPPKTVASRASSSKKDEKPLDTKPVFPNPPNLPGPLDGMVSAALAKAERAWVEGDYANALALLRAAERDAPIGFVLIETRRSVEHSLDLDISPDEDFAPPVLLMVICGISALLALFFFLLSRRVTSSYRRGYFLFVLFLSIALISGGRLIAVRLDVAGYLGSGAPAVLRSCVAYRVPDVGSGLAATFGDGQTVRLRSSAGGWTYVESMDGRSGWIPGDRVIRY